MCNWCHLYRVFTYIYSLLIEKDICDCWNISIMLACVYVCLSSGDLFIFLVRVSSSSSFSNFVLNFVCLTCNLTLKSPHDYPLRRQKQHWIDSCLWSISIHIGIWWTRTELPWVALEDEGWGRGGFRTLDSERE